MEFSLQGNTQEELTASFQQIIMELQQAAMKESQEAAVAGDMDKVTEIQSRLQEVVDEINSEFTARIEALFETPDEDEEEGNSDSPYEFECTANLDLIVYDGDRDAYLGFENDPDIQEAYTMLQRAQDPSKTRKHLMTAMFPLEERIAPNLYAISNRCREALGISAKIKLHTYQDDHFNAACYPPENGELKIALSSGLVERFKDDEIAFVIGHEIGHTLFNHYKYPSRAIMEIGESILSPLHAMKLFAWGRAAEISADRVGLLCCQDFTAAARTFFKLSSGVTSDALDFHLQEYVNQFVDLSTEMAESETDPSDWYSTHPFSPIRIKALEIFNRSKTYMDLIKKDRDWEFTEEQMEDEIAQFMSLMEPSYLNSESDTGRQIQEYIFLSGYLVASSDGTVDDSEMQALGRIVHPEIFEESMAKIQDMEVEDIQQHIVDLTGELNTVLSPMQKLNILRDVSVISYADGEIAQSEAGVLYNLASLFGINTDFIDQVLNSALAELD